MSVLVSFLERNQEWRIYLMYHVFLQAPSMVSVKNCMYFDILEEDISGFIAFGFIQLYQNLVVGNWIFLSWIRYIR